GAGVWHAEAGEMKRLFEDEYRPLAAAVASEDGRMVVSAHHMETRAQVWEARTGRVRATLPLRVHPRQVALSRDGRLLAVAGQGVLEVWDLALEKGVARFDLPREPILALA